ncbi:MAG: cyclopropane fatty acyl phospholipid synthase [Gammaproteobacteria bacterium]
MNRTIDNTHNKFRTKLEKLLEGTSIYFNGTNPWDIKVYNPNLYERILTQGSVGLGEAYMDEWWDCDQLDELFNKFFSGEIDSRTRLDPHSIKNGLWAYFSNRQSKNLASKIIKHHYDIGNDLYQAMLDRHWVYSSGYWKSAKSLDEAQEHKFDLICRKLNLKPGQKILDLGCGWGGFMKHAAENYGVSCVGITLSEQQYDYAKTACKELPIEIRLADYRELEEGFDHIISIGMFEHVGFKNYSQYMKIARRCLKDGGLFLLHTIGGNKSVVSTDPWMDKYIFPGGQLPSVKQIGKATEGLFVMEDWHNFGADYDRTLMAWYKNFMSNWESIKHNYDDRFFRMWKYYLLCCAGTFRARENQLWQIVFSKRGVPGGYVSVR